MTIQRIPLTVTGPWFSMRVMLERREYALEMRWNDRAGRWFWSLSDAAGLIVARPLTPNRLLLIGVVDARRPPGELLLFDRAGAGTPIGIGDLGTRAVLDYLEASDVAALAGVG